MSRNKSTASYRSHKKNPAAPLSCQNRAAPHMTPLYSHITKDLTKTCPVAAAHTPQPHKNMLSSNPNMKSLHVANNSKSISRPVTGIVLMFLGLGLYPLSDAFIKHLLGSYTLYQTTFLRALSRLVPLLCATLWQTGSFSLLKTQHPQQHAIRLLVSVISTYCFMYACSISSLTSMYTLSYTSPIFMVILSATVLKERIDVSIWGAVLVGFLGVIVALQPHSDTLLQYGALIILVGTFFGALNKILMRKLTGTEHSLTISIYPNIAILVVTAPILLGNWSSMPIEHWGIFAIVGIISALAQYFVAQALRFTEASRLAPIDYSTLFWATLIDYARWEILPHFAIIAGAGIITVSNIYILQKTQRTQKTTSLK